jgi:hypothetical protein
LGKAAGKTVENIVETDTLEAMVPLGERIEEVVLYKCGMISPEPSPGPGEAAGTVIKQRKPPLGGCSTGRPVIEFPAPVGQIAGSATGFKMEASDMSIEMFLQIRRRAFPDIRVPYPVDPRIIEKECRKYIRTYGPPDFPLKLIGLLECVGFAHVKGRQS